MILAILAIFLEIGTPVSSISSRIRQSLCMIIFWQALLACGGAHEHWPKLPRSKTEDEGAVREEVSAAEPRAFLVPHFLSEVETDHLIMLGAGGIARSTVQGEVSRTRTSLNTWIRRDTDEITERLFKRLADVAKIPEAKMWHSSPGVVEMIQLV